MPRWPEPTLSLSLELTRQVLHAAVAGNFTANAAGTITAGVDDSDDNGNVLPNNPLTGSIPVATTGRGVATLNTNTILGTLVFAYYVVDATHLKLSRNRPEFRARW